jgi:hypothetical protein
MIFPNRCQIAAKCSYDEYGQQRFDLFVTEKCAIVKLQAIEQHTSVRADQQASRAYADERLAVSTLLMMPKSVIKIDDKVVIGGLELKTKSIRQQYTASGMLDHLECGFEIWV